MTTDLREKIAEVLAGHRIGLVGVNTWRCSCGGWTGTRSLDVPHELVKADYERHVAEAILAAIGERREVTEYAQHPDHGPIWTAFVGPVRAHFKRTITQFEHTGPWLPVDTENPVGGEADAAAPSPKPVPDLMAALKTSIASAKAAREDPRRALTEETE